MANFTLKEEDRGGPTIDELVDSVAKDLGLSNDAHIEVKLMLKQNYIRSIEALRDAVRDKKLCGVIHPYIADAIISKLNNRPIGIFDLEEYDEARLEVRNPSHFHNMAIFVHHVAPVPGTSKGKIACTWAFDEDPEQCQVLDLIQRLEPLVNTPPERMRLVFNGLTLSATSLLSDYDIQGGDSMYLYTLKDPNERTHIVCTEEGPCPCTVPSVDIPCASGGVALPCQISCICPQQHAHIVPCRQTAVHHGRPIHGPCGEVCSKVAGGCRSGCISSTGLMLQPCVCHSKRCFCGACVASSYSPLNKKN